VELESPGAFDSLLQLSQQLLAAASPAAVCSAACTTAAGLTGADFATVLLLDVTGTQLLPQALHGWETAWVPAGGLPLALGSQSAHALMLREPVVTPDYAAEQRFHVLPSIRAQGVRSGAAVPLLAGERARGVLVVHSRRTDGFSARDLRWLRLLANQTAVALAGVEVVERERRRAEQLRLINEISRRLTRTLDPDEQIRGVVSALAELFGYSDVSVMLLDDTGRHVELHSGAGPLGLDARARYRQSVEVGIVGYVVRSGQTYLAPDLRQDPYYYCPPGQSPMGTELCVPLLHESGPLGVLNIETAEPGSLRAEDRVVAETLADQLATALSNARLYREARGRLDHLLGLQQTTLDIVRQRELGELLQRILERAAGLLGADAGMLYLLAPGGAELELVAAHQVAAAPVHRRLPLGEGLAGRVAQSGQPLIVNDYETWSGRWPAYQGLAIGAVVGVPMKWQGRVIGELDVWLAPGKRQFGPDEMWLLSLYADQAAVAIENARLLDAEQQRRARLDALYQVTQAVNATLDTRRILSEVTDAAMRGTAATHGQILLVNAAEGVFERHVLRGFSEEVAERATRIPLPIGRGINGRAFASRAIINVDDVLHDPDYVPLVPETRAELAVPILRGDAVLANIDLQAPRPGAFDHADFDFLRALADQAAIALENARLFEDARRRLAELTVLHEVAVVAAHAMNVDALLAGTTAILARGLDADRAGVLLAGADGRLRFHPSYRGLPAGAEALSFGPGEGPFGGVLASAEPRLAGDSTLLTAAEAAAPRIRSQLAVPLVAAGEVIGVLAIESHQPGAYGEADQRLLTTLAGQIATAIEKLRLIDAERRHAVRLEQHVADRTQALREQTERTEAILRSVAEPVLLVTTEGAIALHNPVAEILLAEPALGPALREVAARLARSPELAGPELISGGGLTLEAHASRVTTGTGPLGTVIVLHDVTRLYELSRLKSEFVSNVSHELRTPLTNMKMYINLLQKGRPDRQTAYMETLRRETWRLERLVEDLLTISRLDMGTTRVVLGPAALNEPLAELVADRQELAAERGVALRGQWSPDAPVALADVPLIVQAVGNLVSNSVAYTPPGGSVIACSDSEWHEGLPWLAIRVSDTGPGIAPSEQARVFERFYRGEAAHALNVPGTGMGLAIVKEIVDRHGGQVHVVSRAGEGATVTILLPTVADEPVAAPGEAAAERAGA
jgi:GAF domain-containing protein